MSNWSRVAKMSAAALGGVAAYDLTQKKHAILRNFPVLGHFRYMLETVGPELRQYIVTDNNSERPFSRDQRSWIYASSKLREQLLRVRHRQRRRAHRGLPDHQAPHVRRRRCRTPTPSVGEETPLPSAKVLGGPRGRAKAFRPQSLVNVSAMSYGSLSRQAITAINKGAAQAGCMHNTGEGGLSPYHRQGGDLVFQIGTAYFGCRDEHGRFDLDRLKAVVASAPVKALEIKLSQGAKPGLGGHLPGAKVTSEIAEIRGIPEGVDCISPSRHAEFDDVDSMLDWVELLASRDRAAGRDQVGGRRPGLLGGARRP